MEKLNLKNFLIRYNFRKAPDEYEGIDYLTDVIRIYLDDENENNWIELGVYDFDNLEDKIKRLDATLNQDILYRQVTMIEYNEELGKTCVILSK
ncbi:MAG: hypothetical protein IJJ82_07950 [Clostridia bacterium]|nr:hypothetical protein [Clostridia bacterium]